MRSFDAKSTIHSSSLLNESISHDYDFGYGQKVSGHQLIKQIETIAKSLPADANIFDVHNKKMEIYTLIEETIPFIRKLEDLLEIKDFFTKKNSANLLINHAALIVNSHTGFTKSTANTDSYNNILHLLDASLKNKESLQKSEVMVYENIFIKDRLLQIKDLEPRIVSSIELIIREDKSSSTSNIFEIMKNVFHNTEITWNEEGLLRSIAVAKLNQLYQINLFETKINDEKSLPTFLDEAKRFATPDMTLKHISDLIDKSFYKPIFISKIQYLVNHFKFTLMEFEIFITQIKLFYHAEFSELNHAQVFIYAENINKSLNQFSLLKELCDVLKKLQVKQEKLYKGVWLSLTPQYHFGGLAFGFGPEIFELDSKPSENFNKHTEKGLGVDLPLTKGLAILGVYSKTKAEERRILSKKGYHNVKMVSYAQLKFIEKEISQSLERPNFPKAWR